MHVASTMSANGKKIIVQVTDSGIGIDSKDLPSLFEQFAVVDDQTSTKYGGTGVGLALTRKLSRMMGGDVSVKTTLGAGSCFTLYFPQHIELFSEPGLATRGAEQSVRTAHAPDSQHALNTGDEQRKVA